MTRVGAYNSQRLHLLIDECVCHVVLDKICSITCNQLAINIPLTSTPWSKELYIIYVYGGGKLWRTVISFTVCIPYLVTTANTERKGRENVFSDV